MRSGSCHGCGSGVGRARPDPPVLSRPALGGTSIGEAFRSHGVIRSKGEVVSEEKPKVKPYAPGKSPMERTAELTRRIVSVPKTAIVKPKKMLRKHR